MAKALSIRQPWAWAILHGGKDVENRTWPTKFRGTVVVHAGAQFDKLEAGLRRHFFQNGFSLKEAPRGALIGIVDVVGCIRSEESESDWAAEPGCYCFQLANPKPFAEPIPWKGKLGFFDVPDEFLEVMT